jgi:rare lipoprotein A
VVRINDRGPFVAGRIIDLSKAAAEALEMMADGVADVRLNVIYDTVASAGLDDATVRHSKPICVEQLC